MPEGIVLLGVDPTSCEPEDWLGGTASAAIRVGTRDLPLVLGIELASPAVPGMGLRSSDPDRIASLSLNDRVFWSKRTRHPGESGRFYAAAGDPVLISAVIREPGLHTITIHVPAQTVWELSRIEISAYPYPGQIKGIAYSPYRDCQYPGGADQPTTAELEGDLIRLAHGSTTIRTYGAVGANGRIPAIAKSLGLEVFAGAWIDWCGIEERRRADDRQIEALVALADSTNVDALIVGNEYCLRDTTPADVDYLIERIEEVRAAVADRNIPITTAESAGIIFSWGHDTVRIDEAYRPVLDRIDFVLVHLYPFWDGLPIDGAARLTIEQYNAIRDLLESEYPGENKRVIIGEAGWPSGGSPHGEAVPSLENHQRYLREFMPLAERYDVDYLYFSAFDELLKHEEPGGVGQHWGCGYTDRSAKHAVSGLILPGKRLADAGYGTIDEPFRLPLLDADGPVVRVYDEWPPAKPDSARSPRFIPSGFMGDTSHINLFECDRADPMSGGMSARIELSLRGPLGWGGIYWLANNSWTGPGFDLHEALGADHGSTILLTFWARGTRGDERVQFKVGGVTDGNDSIDPPLATPWIELDPVWKQYTIDLTGRDLSNLVGGFCWVSNRNHNRGSRSLRFYLDDVRFEAR